MIYISFTKSVGVTDRRSKIMRIKRNKCSLEHSGENDTDARRCVGSPSRSSCFFFFFFFSSRRRHTRLQGDWSSDVCSSDLIAGELRPARVVVRDGLALEIPHVEQVEHQTFRPRGRNAWICDTGPPAWREIDRKSVV